MNFKCRECNTNYRDSLAIYSITKLEKCPACYKKWLSLPENDPQLTGFEVTYETRSEGSVVIYAKDEGEALERFEEEYGDSETDVLGIKELPKKVSVFM